MFDIIWGDSDLYGTEAYEVVFPPFEDDATLELRDPWPIENRYRLTFPNISKKMQKTEAAEARLYKKPSQKKKKKA
jgi:hypothetical protein